MRNQFKGTTTMHLGDKKLFFYSVDKKDELFKMNFKGIDEFFAFLDTHKAIGHAMILFDGYNDVTTELFEIPQVRKFVKEMFKRYPHLLNYVNFDLEGHHSLLSCLLDLETGYAGEKLTFDQHIKKYGIHTPMPRFNVRLYMPREQILEHMKAMYAHGNRLQATKKVNSQVDRFITIFGYKK